MTVAPTLVTERLALRMPVLADFEPRAAFNASMRSIWIGGPLDRVTAWRMFASEVGLWPLMGFGPWTVTDRRTGAYLGEAGVYRSQDYPEPGLGWFVVPEAEGRGIATEAALQVKAWARRSFGWDRLLVTVAVGNTRSLALARRVGGQPVEGGLPGEVVLSCDLRGGA